MEDDVKNVRGVKVILAGSGGGFIGGVNGGNIYVRMVPHEERIWSFSRIWNGLRHAYHHVE